MGRFPGAARCCRWNGRRKHKGRLVANEQTNYIAASNPTEYCSQQTTDDNKIYRAFHLSCRAPCQERKNETKRRNEQLAGTVPVHLIIMPRPGSLLQLPKTPLLPPTTTTTTTDESLLVSSSSSSPQLWLEERRELNSNDGDYVSLYVDSNGNEYEPYSMGWRYLGMYLDCENGETTTSYANGDDQVERLRQRELGSGSGDGGACARKLLWAAVSIEWDVGCGVDLWWWWWLLLLGCCSP